MFVTTVSRPGAFMTYKRFVHQIPRVQMQFCKISTLYKMAFSPHVMQLIISLVVHRKVSDNEVKVKLD